MKTDKEGIKLQGLNNLWNEEKVKVRDIIKYREEPEI